MNHTIPAVFDAGVFRPLVPVELAEGTRVEVGIPEAAPSKPPYDRERLMKFIGDMEAIPDDSPQQHDAASWQQFVADMEAMPDNSEKDGFSNRDHDRLLYGG